MHIIEKECVSEREEKRARDRDRERERKREREREREDSEREQERERERESERERASEIRGESRACEKEHEQCWTCSIVHSRHAAYSYTSDIVC